MNGPPPDGIVADNSASEKESVTYSTVVMDSTMSMPLKPATSDDCQP